jgi:hypothetical protein
MPPKETGLVGRGLEDVLNVWAVAADTHALLSMLPPDDHRAHLMGCLRVTIDAHVAEIRRRAELAQTVAELVTARWA